MLPDMSIGWWVLFPLMLPLLVLIGVVAGMVALVRAMSRHPSPCPGCGKTYRKHLLVRRGENLCPTCRLPPLLPGLPSRTRIASGLASFAILIAFAVAQLHGRFGMALFLALPLGVVAVVIFVVTYAMVRLAWSGQQPMTRTLLLLLRVWRGFDLWAARRAAHTPGQLVRAGPLLIWMEAGGQDLALRLQGTVEATGGAFGRLTGLTDPAERPCRVLCFETEAAYQRYLRPAFGEMGRHAGSYAAPSRVLLCRQVADLAPGGFDRAAAHEFAHHFMAMRRATFGAAWWQEGLATVVAAEAVAPRGAAGAALRVLKAAAARDVLLAPDSLLTMSHDDVFFLARAWKEPPAYLRLAVFYEQSAALVRYLMRSRPEGFADFLGRIKSLRRTDELDTAFRDCFASSALEAVEAWRQEMLSEPVPPPGPVPAEVQARFEKQWAPAALDLNAEEEQRRLAIRLIGYIGYPQWLEPVRQVADRPDDPMREEAAIARDILMAGDAAQDAS